MEGTQIVFDNPVYDRMANHYALQFNNDDTRTHYVTNLQALCDRFRMELVVTDAQHWYDPGSSDILICVAHA